MRERRFWFKSWLAARHNTTPCLGDRDSYLGEEGLENNCSGDAGVGGLSLFALDNLGKML